MADAAAPPGQITIARRAPVRRGLTMSVEQMDMFAAVAEARFRKKLLAHLRSVCPARVARLDDAALAAFIDAAVGVARAQRFTWQSSIAAFVTLMAVVSPDFHRDPKIAAALEKARPAGNARLRFIAARLNPRDWARATVPDPEAAITAFMRGTRS